jgi:hypothetical protein
MIIVEEVLLFKEAVASKHGFDIAQIVDAARKRQEASVHFAFFFFVLVIVIPKQPQNFPVL